MNKIKKIISAIALGTFLSTTSVAMASTTDVIPVNSKDNVNYEAKSLLFTKTKDQKRTLLFSDSPESVTENGVLYRDTVVGKGRILYYHLPLMKEPQKVVVVLENNSKKKAKFTVEREGVAGPSKDYLKVGKTALERYYDKQKPYTIVIPPKGKAILHPSDDQRVINKDELVDGVFDFKVNVPINVTVLMAPYLTDTLAYVDYAKVLPTDEHRLRGTFTKSDREITNLIKYDPVKQGDVYFYLADNVDDKYQDGVDATDGTKTQNYGNYGINYHIKIKSKGPGTTSVFIQPLGGVYAGAVAVKSEGRYRLVSTPQDRKFMGEDGKYNYYTYVTTFRNSDGLDFLYTPPGASNLPIKVILKTDI